MPHARSADRVRIYDEEHGPREEAISQPLVLAYGIGGNADMWDVNRSGCRSFSSAETAPSLGAMRVMHRRIRGSRLVVLSPASPLRQSRSAGARETARRSTSWPAATPREGRAGVGFLKSCSR